MREVGGTACISRISHPTMLVQPEEGVLSSLLEAYAHIGYHSYRRHVHLPRKSPARKNRNMPLSPNILGMQVTREI
jgi:hypothetical protein